MYTKVIISAIVLLAVLLLASNCRSSSDAAAATMIKSQPATQLLYPKMKLIGKGTFVYAGFFRIYDAEYYHGSDLQNRKHTPELIKLIYHRPVGAEDSRDANNKAIKLHASKSDIEAYSSDWQQLNQFVMDVKKGDELYVLKGKQGLTLHYPHANKKITINNVKLAQHYIDIWIGKNPLNKSLRRKLLGSKQETKPHGR